MSCGDRRSPDISAADVPAVDTRIERHRNVDSPCWYLGVLLALERTLPVINAALSMPAGRMIGHLQCCLSCLSPSSVRNS